MQLVCLIIGDVGGNQDDHHQDDGYDFDNSADYEQPEGDDDEDGMGHFILLFQTFVLFDIHEFCFFMYKKCECLK